MWVLAVWTMLGPAGTYAQTLSDFKFNSRVRETDESVATYVAALRHQSCVSSGVLPSSESGRTLCYTLWRETIS